MAIIQRWILRCAFVLMVAGAVRLAWLVPARALAQDDSSGMGDVFATNTVDTMATYPDEEATPTMADNFDTSDWENDPGVTPSESDDYTPDNSTDSYNTNTGSNQTSNNPPSNGTQMLMGGVNTTVYVNPGNPGAGPASKTFVQGNMTVYQTPKGNPYCCSGPARQCFNSINAIIRGCAPPGNERAAGAVHQMGTALQAFRKTPDATHLAAAKNAIDQWQNVPMTPKAGAYVDCYEAYLQASFAAEQMQQASQNSANYSQVRDANVRAQMQNAMNQITATYQGTFDKAMTQASGCTATADGAPARPAASSLKAQAAVTVISGKGQKPEQYRVRISTTGHGTPQHQDGQPFHFSLAHRKGSNYAFRSGTGRIATGSDGTKYLLITSLTSKNGQRVTPRGTPPLLIVPPAKGGSASPAARAAELAAIRNARQSVLQRYARSVDQALGSVPGLSNTLQTGAALTKKMDDDLKNSYSFTASPYAGLRLIRDALAGEMVGKAVAAGGGIVSASSARLSSLVAKSAATSATETSLAAEVAQVEVQENAAIAQAVAKAVVNTDPALAANLAKAVAKESVTDKRVANALLNQIIYNLETIARAGNNPAEVLSNELRNAGFSGEKLRLTQLAVLQNWRVARQVNAFAPRAAGQLSNFDRMRVGLSAILSNGQKLEVDHTIPFKSVPDLANVLANLHYITRSQNASISNTITEATYRYAEILEQAGWLNSTQMQGLAKEIRLVK